MTRFRYAVLAMLLAVPSFAGVPTGETAPDFSLPDTKGAERSLSDFKGQTVVLEWHNRDCPFVRKHYDSGNMQGLQKKYTAAGVVWLAILSSAKGKQGYAEGDEAERDMVKADAAPTHILLDPSGEVGRLYGAKTTPHMFVIGPSGKLRYQGAIDSIRSTDPADIAKAENYAAQALDAVLAGKPVAAPTTMPYGCSVKYGPPPEEEAPEPGPPPVKKAPWWKFWGS